MLEYRFAELRAGEGDSPTVTGTAIRYGDIASIGGRFRETFRAGAFGAVAEADVVLNLHHAQAIPVARTGGGGLELRDSADSLDAVVNMPPTQDAIDAIALIRAGVIRGFSIEFVVPRGGDSFAGDLRTVTRAEIRGLGLVARPAYGDSLAAIAERAARAASAGDPAAFRPWEWS